MAYVQVPKDLTKVKQKVALNLTKRQLICFTLAGAVGVPFYLLTKGILGSTISASIMVVMILPFFFFAMYERDGRPLEKVLYDIINQKFLRPGIRTYQTNNIYGKLQDEIYEREVLGIGREEGKTDSKKAGHKFRQKGAKTKSGKAKSGKEKTGYAKAKKTADKCQSQDRKRHRNREYFICGAEKGTCKGEDEGKESSCKSSVFYAGYNPV